jgi:hypothetical protein
VIVVSVLICIVALYVAICGAIFIYQEIRAEINKLKRNIKQAIWDIEWQIKLLRRK